ncbi:hypothetical protein NIES4075_25020 [Tolypothrix sp. NIES-4075]|uniref:hypothetical protein n=1 Tax=Tolypothrix sp. NIES-4075 TaxID=2005459 RepID=UPI000B5C485C|nr:hypothetical protein [Tolypothrix sp. NIES-4075]GAX41529.1 hypothetical protein NIES4075_25020 [Tolypothrix sp. NIES-4075]
MGRILELQNGDNFSLQYTNSIPATSIEMVNGKDIYAKLTEVIIPVVFNKPIILVNISTSVPVGKIWRYAGRVRQIFPTVFGDSFVDDKPLFLGKRNLIVFSEILSDYTLNYLPPSWFVDVSITIYQYEGTDTTTLENDVQAIKEAIGV